MWGESKLAKMAYSGPLASHFVNDDYVMAESLCSAAHEHHKVLAWSRVVCGNVVPCYVCCYGCCTSQKRTNVSAVPLRIFF